MQRIDSAMPRPQAISRHMVNALASWVGINALKVRCCKACSYNASCCSQHCTSIFEQCMHLAMTGHLISLALCSIALMQYCLVHMNGYNLFSSIFYRYLCSTLTPLVSQYRFVSQRITSPERALKEALHSVLKQRSHEGGPVAPACITQKA